MGCPARHGTDTAKHDTIRHDTTEHERVVVPCRAITPCRLLGPRTTRTSLSRVVPARQHGKHVVSCWAICTTGKKRGLIRMKCTDQRFQDRESHSKTNHLSHIHTNRIENHERKNILSSVGTWQWWRLPASSSRPAARRPTARHSSPRGCTQRCRRRPAVHHSGGARPRTTAEGRNRREDGRSQGRRSKTGQPARGKGTGNGCRWLRPAGLGKRVGD
jgi:hypothetical protein